MTTVVIPPAADASGQAVDFACRLRLIDAQGRARLSWKLADGTLVSESRYLTLGAAPVEIDLIPQSALGVDTGATATFYEFTLGRLHASQGETYRVQVPESAEPVPLADLIGAAAIPPGDILAGRLLPPASQVPNFLLDYLIDKL